MMAEFIHAYMRQQTLIGNQAQRNRPLFIMVKGEKFGMRTCHSYKHSGVKVLQ